MFYIRLIFTELRSRIRQNYTGLSGRRFRRVLKDIMDFRMKKRMRLCRNTGNGTIKEQGYRIGMASSKPEVSCRRILEHFGILPLFDDVVGATFDGTRDKKSEILKEVMRRWSHIPKSEMCLIGDTMFDVNGAKELGIFCIAVSYGFGDVEEMKAAGVAGMCDSLEQLPELLRKLHTCDVHKNR